MKKCDVKKHISRDVRVAYIKGDKSIKTDAVLHSADPITEIAEVYCINGDRVRVHFSQLRKIKKVILPIEEKLSNCATNTYTTEEAQKAFQSLREAYLALKFYADTRSWMESTSGRFLGQIVDIKWSRAQEAIKHVEENFI